MSERAVERAEIEQEFAKWQGQERVGEWIDAAHAWLQTRHTDSTREAYWLSLREFLRCVPRPLWEATPNEVRAWMQSLQRRGLSSNTISLRMSGLSSFYAYAMGKYWIFDETGAGRPLFDRNPVLAVDRPKIVPYRTATYLTKEEARRLLGAIPQETLQGKRDYSLFLTYILTGRRSKEIRTLRWDDLRIEAEEILYHWKNKGSERWDLLPMPAWAAIRTYLEAAGRWGKMVASDYLFTPLTDRATRLPTVRAEDWTRNKALSGREVGRLLKGYIRDAGIEKDIHLHSLRHTAAELYRDAGLDIFAVSKLLAHGSVDTTRIYFDHLDGFENTAWAEVAVNLGLVGVD